MTTLSSVINAYIADRSGRGEIGPSTARQLRCRLDGLLAVSPVDELAGLDRLLIRRWQVSIGHLRPASRRAYTSTVATFCRWALEEGWLSVDPCEHLARVREPRHEPRALSDAQVARLLLVLPNNEARLIVRLMLDLGLRCIEVSRLEGRHYDPAAATVLVIGKGSDERMLPVRATTAQLLDDVVAARTLPAERLLGHSPNRISVLVSGWMRAAGIKQAAWDRVSAHSLRHTFASNLFDRCHNVRIVQAALGHANVATTDRYLRGISVEEIRAAMGGDYPPAA